MVPELEKMASLEECTAANENKNVTKSIEPQFIPIVDHSKCLSNKNTLIQSPITCASSSGENSFFPTN